MPAPSPSTSPRAVRYESDQDGIVTLTMDDPEASVNTMNDAFLLALEEVLDRLEATSTEVTGVVVASGKRTFSAGADLAGVPLEEALDEDAFFRRVERVKAALRRLETCGVPVVAAINGTALGGGLEIALACHHRVAVDDPAIRLGLPEVGWGLLPGGGGVTRTVRMLGLQAALSDVLLHGQVREPRAAAQVGLIDAVVADADELRARTRQWIFERAASGQQVAQPWDLPGHEIPGGLADGLDETSVLELLPGVTRRLFEEGGREAPRAVLAAALEGARVDFDTASRVESRYLTDLVAGQQFRNILGLQFVDPKRLRAQNRALSESGEVPPVARLGVLGAGMMGAGIAHAAAMAGIGVVLVDVSADQARKGLDHCTRLLDRSVRRGALTAEQRDAVLSRITASASSADLAGADVVVEAVFEDAELKRRLMVEVEGIAGPDCLVASNTSTIPIVDLASALARPENFLGLHFFSPVDRMGLVEIVRGRDTSPTAVARALAVVDRLGKTPIVVNDGRGFFTSRVIATLVAEATALVAEGVAPATVERAATLAGFPAPPLAMVDEVGLPLTLHIRADSRRGAEAAGETWRPPVGHDVFELMVHQLGRTGRAAGGGFYDYPPDGPKRLWPGLQDHFAAAPDVGDVPLRDVMDRYLFIMCLETAQCFEEGVLGSEAAANVGSFLGIAFPVTTGGTARFMTTYPGGLPGFVARARELAATYGSRFEPSGWLVDRAERGLRLEAAPLS